jgi:ABC-type Fe3+-hydroxamate transport system substrate-binding protein
MFIYCDQLNREIVLPSTPKRIVSIVPSQTELLFDLGLTDEIAGISKFCVHPEEKVKKVVKVGGTKQLDIEKINSLHPDLIIANKEENERSQVETLMSICPVWISDIKDMTGAINMIERVGELVGKAIEARRLAEEIARKFENLTVNPSNKRVAYFIWRKPYMVAGKGTFIDSMLQRCGLKNAFELKRYPEINPERLLEANPDLILLSSEPYPFRERHIDEFQAIVPHSIIKLVDGELFSWYGSRLLYAPEYFRCLLAEFDGVGQPNQPRT